MKKEARLSYAPLWETLRNRNISKYELTILRGFNKGTLYRIEKNNNVNISTIIELCGILDCNIEDIVKAEIDEVEE